MPKVSQKQYSLDSDLESFRVRQSASSILNLIALSTLLLIHVFFANHFGLPTPSLVLLLGAAFLLRTVELIWAQSRAAPLSTSALQLLTWASITLNFGLAFVAALLTNRPDAQYFVLLAMPVIEAAFRFNLFTTTAVIVSAGAFNFFWMVVYAFHQRGPINPSEYFEAGTISLIYAFVGLLVWTLVSDLRRNQEALTRNMSELERARERLVTEEKLAAVGRLSSAIAHEIRNPVAMISSSLATAARGNLDMEQRQAMYEIATKEAARLDELTNDFLAYARPRPPKKSVNNICDLLTYVADLSRAQAESKHINLSVDAPVEVLCECDLSGLQQVLLNLVMNAIDACLQNGTVTLRASKARDLASIEVENPSNGIAPDVTAHIFEPFFTTKPQGTGLGLAIARSVARNQGGDISLLVNGPEHVVFSVTVPLATEMATTTIRS